MRSGRLEAKAHIKMQQLIDSDLAPAVKNLPKGSFELLREAWIAGEFRTNHLRLSPK